MEQQARDSDLYKMITSFTWYIEAEGVGKNDKPVQNMFSGFSIRKGLIMTVDHGLANIVKNCNINGRRLNSEAGCGDKDMKSLVLVNKMHEFDLALLKVEQEDENEDENEVVAEFGDGELEVGQKIVAVGSMSGFLAPYFTGNVAYKCIREVTIPTDNMTCHRFDIASYRCHPYRIYGHMHNNKNCTSSDFIRRPL